MFARLRKRVAGSLVLVLACALLAAACGDDDEVTDTTTTAAPTTTSTTEAETITTTSTSTTVGTSSSDTPVNRVIEYATHAQRPLTLDMYVPAETDGAPIVLFLPGGFGMGMSVLEPLAEAGAIVFHVRPAQRAAEATTLLADHGAVARAQADSMACAIRFARVRASELGSDDPVVVLTSFSWGGGLAAHAALFGTDLQERWDEYAAEGGPQREVDCVVPTGSTQVDGLVAIGGAYDHFVPAWDGPAGIYGLSYQQERDPELWQFLYSSIGAAPDLVVRLIHGTTDSVVPFEMAVEFAAVLDAAGYDVQVKSFEGGHTLPVDLAVSTIMEVLEP
jgi:acetyl esterase/lipase